LKEKERWFVYDQTIEVVDEVSYLAVTTERTGGWNKHNTKEVVKGKQALVDKHKFSKTT
jgi:hypothetical protein